MNDQVVITGTSLVSSVGLTAEESWQSLVSQKSGIKPIEDFDAKGFSCRSAAQVKGVGAQELDIHPRDSRIMDKHAYMLMKSSRDVYADAELVRGNISGDEIGFFAAMGMVDYNVQDLLPAITQCMDDDGAIDYDKFYSDTFRQIHPLWPLSMLNNINFCQAAIDLGIKGENTTFAPHSDSGTHSVIEAFNTVLEKKAQVVLAGGVSEKVSPLSLGRAQWFNILNLDNNASCSPFGSDRKGTVLGEGAGMISVEMKTNATKRGAQILAAITGYGASFEKSHESNAPTGRAISLSMEQALAKAGVTPSDIDLVIAHGDGTIEGDKNEIEAINRTFADTLGELNVYSSKGAIGHLLSGAAAADTVIGIYMMKNGIIPPVYGTLGSDESIAFNLVHGAPLAARPRRILINSSSYEGQCASLIIEAVE